MSYIWHVGGPDPCKVCQERDGKVFEGQFEPAHPNCTCWPEQLPDWYGTDMTEIAPGIFTPGPIGGGQTYVVLGKARDVPLWNGKNGQNGVKVAFVAASPGQYDVLRKTPLAGSDGAAFNRAVLEPLKLTRQDIGITYLVPRTLKARGRIRPPSDEEIARCRAGLIQDLRTIQPQIIVALGSQASRALGSMADATLPHPAAMDKAEPKQLNRVLQKIKKLQKAEQGLYARKPFLWPERRALIKALQANEENEEKRLVWAIVLEPDTPDGEGDVFSAKMIEEIAHKYTAAINREFQNWHSGQSFEAELVESEIAKTNYVWQGQAVKKGSWVVCIHILSEWMWKLVRAGIYRGISVGGGYIHVARTEQLQNI